jgi:hypothetical protein
VAKAKLLEETSEIKSLVKNKSSTSEFYTLYIYINISLETVIIGKKGLDVITKTWYWQLSKMSRVLPPGSRNYDAK